MDERTPIKEFLWRVWGTLGVSSWARGDVEAVVDPEGLIALTLARGDTRLVHESIDWAVSHANLLLVTRIRKYAAEIGAQDAAESWIATVSQHSPNVAWTTKSAPLPSLLPSGKSGSFDGRGASGGAASALRMRAAFGTHMRSEVIRALHPTLAGLYGPATSAEVVWLAMGTKSQVNGILDELVRAGLVERTGSERRRRYSPMAVADDPLSSSIWSAWDELRFAPWRISTVALAHLDQILMATSDIGPTTSAVEAVMHYNAALPLLARIDQSLAQPFTSGAAFEVSRHIRELSIDAASRVVEILAKGHDGSRAIPKAALRIPAVPPQMGNPWNLRFTGGRPVNS